MSLPKTNRPGILSFFLWFVDSNVEAAAARITIRGYASFTYVSCRLYVRTRLPNTWFILSMVTFFCVFPGEAGLVLIPYSFFIKLFLNLWPRNYPPLSYVISTVHGYRTSYIVSTKFVIVIVFLLLYFVTSNHLVTGSIIVSSFNIIGSFLFLCIIGAYEIYT